MNKNPAVFLMAESFFLFSFYPISNEFNALIQISYGTISFWRLFAEKFGIFILAGI